MIDSDFAHCFAADWIDAWNRHDLDAVLAQCADDIELTAPRLPAPSNRLCGKTTVAAWWARAMTAPSLTVAPRLKLTAVANLAGTESVVLLYYDRRQLRAQTFRFQPDGRVIHTAIHQQAPRAPGKPHVIHRP